NIMGYHGAWVAKVINMLVLSLIAIIYIYMNKEAEKFRDKMLLLPRSFGIPPENEISVIAHSEKEIEELSRVAISFAMEQGADKKRARTFGLITEELGIFLAEHGFNDGKPHTINARLVAKDEELIIRMRDDCKPLNLTEYYKFLNTPEEKEKEAGLAIIMNMAKEVIYTPTFGANNLIIKI
ncbi:MAG: ATP-binding protein, partial [Synergistaceae bacterium]|nr:ATP-binding protein [Synergistaceae bacterium]